MANFKRRKCRRSVRCTLCTRDRWRGNAKGRRKDREKGIRWAKDKEISDA